MRDLFYRSERIDLRISNLSRKILARKRARVNTSHQLRFAAVPQGKKTIYGSKMIAQPSCVI